MVKGEEKVLSAEQVLSSKDIKSEKVFVPEWGGSVYVKALTAAERDQYESSIVEFGSDGKPRKYRLDKVRSLLAAMTICDENGNRLFEDKDVAALGKKSSAALDRVFKAAQSLSAISKKDVEDLADGLKNDQSADSPSG